MKIGQRLAFRFTIVSALLTGAILIITYIITQGVVSSDFIERLSQQSRLEVIHYATPGVRDVIEPGSFLLVNPYIRIYSSDGHLLHSQGDFHIDESWVKFLQKNNLFNANRGAFTTVGRKYTIHEKTYLVFVSARDVAGNHELDILLKAMVAGWLVSLVLSYLAGLYFASEALQPVKHVVLDVNKITEDNLGYRLKLDKDLSKMDEIDELVLTFNDLLNRIESAFIAQKRFVQHASHELKTPLTAIMAEAELALAKDRNVNDYKRTLTVVLDETERLVRATQGLLTLARLEEGGYHGDMETVRIADLCTEAIRVINVHHPGRNIELNVHHPNVVVFGNQKLLEIAVRNILDNAIKYSSGTVKVDLFRHHNETAISIVDEGIGIPPSELEKVRFPLYRGSNVNQTAGAGLGLSLVEKIVTMHAGRLEIKSEEQKGTSCVLKLPVI